MQRNDDLATSFDPIPAPLAPQKEEKDRVITFGKIHGEMWDHSFVHFGPMSNVKGKNYYSPHPEQGRLPGNLDPDDSATQILIIGNNIKTATYTKKTFKDPAELAYSHEAVEMIVNPEQYKRAKELAKREKQEAEKGTAKYGIFPTPKTGSCATFHHNILHEIATPEEKEHIHPIGSFWPTTSFENAKKIAEIRKTPEGQRKHPTGSIPHTTTTVDNSTSQLGLFGQLGKTLGNAFMEGQREKSERHSPWVPRK